LESNVIPDPMPYRRLEASRGARSGLGFEAKGHGGEEQLAIVLNQLMDVTWAAGSIEIPGLSVTADPGSKDVRRAAGRAFDLTRKICTHSAFFWNGFAPSRRIASACEAKTATIC
jgi:hypothetical protein